MKTQQVQLVSTPESTPEEGHFRLADISLPELADNEVLCETQYLSLDPYMRSQISGRHLSGAIAPGDGMTGETISRVIASRSKDFAEE